MSEEVNKSMSIYQIVAKGSFDNATQLRNIHHYEFNGYVPTQTQLQEAVDALDAAYKVELIAYFVNEVQMVSFDVRRVDIGNLPTIEFAATAGEWVGTSAVDPMPAQVSGLVTFKSPTVYPRSSRAYIWPFSEGNNTSSGQISTNAQTAMEDWADAVISLTITGGADADKVAVQYGGTPRAVVDSNILLSSFVNPIWATQRRRRLGVGI